MLERPREPGPPPTVRPPACDVAPLELDRAFVWEVKTRENVDERGFAGAVRADEAYDLVPVELERYVPKRLDALERTPDAGGPERGSGPPRLLGLCFDQRPRSWG